VPEVAPLDPERLVRVLAKHQVRYVLIGALAARLQGFPRLTADADITPDRSRDNLEHLSAALRELGAKVYTESVPEGLPFDCSASALARIRSASALSASSVHHHRFEALRSRRAVLRTTT
jgi:hypothetical protein